MRPAFWSQGQPEVQLLHGGHVLQCPRFNYQHLLLLLLPSAGLIGHQVLYMIEVVKARLLAEGGQVLPASAALYLMGVEMQHLPTEAAQLLAAGRRHPAVPTGRAAGLLALQLHRTPM